MASNFKTPGGNPADQVAQSWRSVSEAFKVAGEKAAERNKELGMCVVKQAEKNASQLFETLQAMATARSPSDLYQLYTKYLNAAVSAQAEQLKEITEVLAKSSKEAWEPISQAVQQASSQRTPI